MKRFLSYFIVFILGFVVCAWTINHYYGSPKEFAAIESVNQSRGGLRIASGETNRVREAGGVVSRYVVNIDTQGRKTLRVTRSDAPFFSVPRLEEFVPTSQASGVIFTPDGYILTNNHVVSGTEKLYVTLYNGKMYDARLIGRDPKTDLAVIKINAKDLEYAKFGNSDTLTAGDWVIAVGNALGLGPTLTLGVVSAIRTDFSIDGKVFEGIIQTDAAINRGNSGGALSDINGSLVGINTAIASTSPGGGSIGIGFAIPSNIAKNIAAEIRKHGKVIRPWLGVQYGGLNEEGRQYLRQLGYGDVPDEGGAWVAYVYPGSPAAKAGIRDYDVILKINGKPISAAVEPEKGKTTIADEMAKAKVGDKIKLEVWRRLDGKAAELTVRVGEMPLDIEERR